MKNIPDKIYLNLGDECPYNADFRNLSEVTWSEDKVNDNDIEYVRKSEWISVEERLPENEHLVYAAFPIEGHLTARLAFYSHKYDRWISFPGTCTLSDVVFWMEMPAIPQLKLKKNNL